MKKSYLLTLLILCSFDNIRNESLGKVKCPNGEIVFRHRNPEKYYKSYVKSTEASIGGSVNILDKVKATDIKASTKQSVTKLRSELDNFSSRFKIF